MFHLSNINIKILGLIICLKSINLEYRFDPIHNMNNIHQYLNSNHSFYYIKTLYLIQKTIDNIKNTSLKKYIHLILEYYSRHKIYFHETKNFLLFQYIKKFTYKYKKNYNLNYINKNYTKYNMNKYALVFLYLLYKILKTNKSLYIYKKSKV